MAYAGIENALVGAAETEFWDELKKIFAWPANAVSTQQYFAGAVGLMAMLYMSDGVRGQPCGPIVTGYFVGGLAYFGAVGLATAPAPPK